MEDNKFEKLMEELHATWHNMDQKLKDSIADVKREVSTMQERTTKEIQHNHPTSSGTKGWKCLMLKWKIPLP